LFSCMSPQPSGGNSLQIFQLKYMNFYSFPCMLHVPSVIFLTLWVRFEPEIHVPNPYKISHSLEFEATVIGCMIISNMKSTYKYHVHSGNQTRVHKNTSLRYWRILLANQFKPQRIGAMDFSSQM
jgi:hypothetical protein